MGEIYKGGLKQYWKRKEYQRLDGSAAGSRRRSNRVELGDGRRRRRFWRIRISPRLRFLRRLPSPRRILARIRDAYVKMMLGLASSAGGYGYGHAVNGFGQQQLKEYDQRMLVEVYKSILAQGHPFAAANAGAVAVHL